MPYLYRFLDDEKFFNTIEAHPSWCFSYYSGSSYINQDRFKGVNIPTGSISLYELNVDRTDGLIYPFIVKDGNMWTFKSVTSDSFTQAEYGTVLEGAYPYTSSLTREYIAATTFPDPWSSATTAAKDAYFNNRKRMISLQNTLNYYRVLSPHYHYTGSYVSGAINLLNVPSIFYGSSIEKGTVGLSFYFTGTLVDRAVDEKRNGELVSTMGATSGTVVGMVLYNEGFIMLTSSEEIGDKTSADDYLGNGNQTKPAWIYFGAYSLDSIPSATSYPTASLYEIEFSGTTFIPTHTMFAEAPAGELNNSQNLTWLSSSNGDWQKTSTFYSSASFLEPQFLNIKNTIQSPYCDYEETFEKQTFLSKIGLFDKDKNLVGLVKVANPVRKKENDGYTFKLKLDL